MKWKILLYHTESEYKTGMPSCSLISTGSRETVVNEAKNLAKARGDYAYEVVPA